ncbi:hypothetical protein JAAARDRAFT_57233 [Jaapia argillacea MUCL 33604]|uniref:Fatty acid desaturase domain-containing protein n=1 Tax=Jaapia argillacea MUCL 33604 TaxID=933084 RepID=A0A067PWU3_9AGAM|nr:hypothetical protein JAAARDRAFT_57233 [Jaapia argillacea MUCL 33604]
MAPQASELCAPIDDIPTKSSPPTKQQQPTTDNGESLTAYREALAITNRHKKRNNFLAILAILNNYVVWGASIALCEYVQSHFPSNGKLWWATYIPAVLLIASRFRAFEHFVHEASHNNLFTNPRAHDWFEFTYAFPVFRLMRVFRTLHLEHHKYLGDPVRDADVVRLIEYGFINAKEPMSEGRFWWLVYGLPFTGWFHYEYIMTLFVEFWSSPLSYPTKAIYWATVLSTVHLTGTWSGFALYFVVPWLGILPITRWWAELGEHLGQNMTGNFGNSRTNDGFWQRWWIHPLNDGLHSAHHLNSQIPFHRLRTAHNELMKENKEYRTKNTMSNGILETFRHIVANPTVVKDTPVGGRAEWNNGYQLWAKNS